MQNPIYVIQPYLREIWDKKILTSGTIALATVHRQSTDVNENAPAKLEFAPLNAPLNAPLPDLQTQLLELLQSDPGVSYDQLVALTQKDRTTVMRNIAKLKAAGRLQRIGSKKSGYWQVLK